MTDLVPAADIERIVGEHRHPHLHLGRAVSAEQIVYILHSAGCRDSTPDLRDCDYSRALDLGIYEGDWTGRQDRPIVLAIDAFGALVPDDTEAS